MHSETLYQFKCECLCNIAHTFIVVYLICQPKQHAEEPSQVTLSGRKLPSARVVRPIECRGAVHDQQSVPGTQQGWGIFIHHLIILMKPTTAKFQWQFQNANVIQLSFLYVPFKNSHFSKCDGLENLYCYSVLIKQEIQHYSDTILHHLGKRHEVCHRNIE